MRVDECIEAYLRARQSANLRSVTIANYTQTLTAFARDLPAAVRDDLETLTPDHIRSWLLARLDAGMADTSVSQHRTVIIQWLRWLRLEGYIDRADYAERVPRLRIDQREPRCLGPDEAALMFETLKAMPHKTPWVGARNLAMVSLLLDTGVRKSELLYMRCEDLDLAGRCVVIRAERKARRERTVPFGSETLRALRAYLSHRREVYPEVEWLWVSRAGARLSQNMLYELLHSIEHKAGLARLHPHALRHSFANLVHDSGMDSVFVQQLLGHKRLETTRHYLHPMKDTIRREYDRVSPIDHLKQK